MFKSKTVFIVGAGASQEAGLPTGAQLKDAIAKLLNITYKVGIDPTSPDTGDGAIAWALVEYVRKTGSGDINPYLFEAWKIRDAMPQAISIDNFIDAHSDSSALVLCGKLGIARAIIEAERKSRMFVDDTPGTISKFNTSKLKDTWYSKLFQLLTENIRKNECHTVFDNVSFIVFNYDRCVEHYLYNALQTYYAISEIDARQLMARLNIYHPYGVVGSLPWQNIASVVFGGRMNMKLLDIASDLRTFTERMDDDVSVAAIRLQIQEAETIVFLGFAFHELNMQLLSSTATSNARRVFGTAKGISNADLTVVKQSVIDALQADKRHASGALTVEIKNELTCSGLFDEYWRSLSQRA